MIVLVLYYDPGINRIESHDYPSRKLAYAAGKEVLDAGAKTIKILEIEPKLFVSELVRIPADLFVPAPVRLSV